MSSVCSSDERLLGCVRRWEEWFVGCDWWLASALQSRPYLVGVGQVPMSSVECATVSGGITPPDHVIDRDGNRAMPKPATSSFRRGGTELKRSAGRVCLWL